MDENPPPAEAPVTKKPEQFLWPQSPAEWRILVITFVGGLASIIVGACILAVAVVVARSMRGPRFNLLGYVGFAFITVLFFVGALLPFLGWREEKSLWVKLFVIVVGGAMGVLGVVFLLACIGLAVGVK